MTVTTEFALFLSHRQKGANATESSARVELFDCGCEPSITVASVLTEKKRVSSRTEVCRHTEPSFPICNASLSRSHSLVLVPTPPRRVRTERDPLDVATSAKPPALVYLRKHTHTNAHLRAIPDFEDSIGRCDAMRCDVFGPAAMSRCTPLGAYERGRAFAYAFRGTRVRWHD